MKRNKWEYISKACEFPSMLSSLSSSFVTLGHRRFWQFLVLQRIKGSWRNLQPLASYRDRILRCKSNYSFLTCILLWFSSSFTTSATVILLFGFMFIHVDLQITVPRKSYLTELECHSMPFLFIWIFRNTSQSPNLFLQLFDSFIIFCCFNVHFFQLFILPQNPTTSPLPNFHPHQ